MPRYLLAIYQPDGAVPSPEVLDAVGRELHRLNGDIKAAGGWVFSGGLHAASSATVVRARDREMLITDGPYIEGKEHIGGFSVIRAADLDAALAWAGRLARIVSPLAVEVRPMHEEHGP